MEPIFYEQETGDMERIYTGEGPTGSYSVSKPFLLSDIMGMVGFVVPGNKKCDVLSLRLARA